STLANRNLGEPIQLSVTVLTSTGSCQGAITFRTVDAFVAGSVYYWDPSSTSHLFRVDVEQAKLVDFMPNPGSNCIRCHAVSRDGRTLVAELSTDTGPLGDWGYDLMQNLTTNPAPTLYGPVNNPGVDHFSPTFNGDGTRFLLSSIMGGPFTLYSGTTGALV